MAKTKVKTYSTFTKILHWLIGITVIFMLVFGFFLDDLPEQYQHLAYMLHKSTGLTILFLMIIRFIWVHATGKPPLPADTPTWEWFLSRFVQYGFYVLLLLMPMSGWIMSVAADMVPSYFGLFNAPLPWIEPSKSLAETMADAHEIIAYIIIAFLVFHISGALKHHFINKDKVLKHMLPEKDK